MRLKTGFTIPILFLVLAALSFGAFGATRTQPLTAYMFPSATVLGNVSTPTAPSGVLEASEGIITAGTHSYKVCYLVGTTTSLPSAKSNVITSVPADHGQVTLAIPASSHASVTSRKIYRTVAGDTGSWLLLATIADNTTLTYVDNLADASLGVAAPTAATISLDTTLSVPTAYAAIRTTIMNTGAQTVYFRLTDTAASTSTDMYLASGGMLVLPEVAWKKMRLCATANTSTTVRVYIGY